MTQTPEDIDEYNRRREQDIDFDIEEHVKEYQAMLSALTHILLTNIENQFENPAETVRITQKRADELAEKLKRIQDLSVTKMKKENAAWHNAFINGYGRGGWFL